MKNKKPKKKMSALDRYCIFCIIFFTAYTIAELTLSSITSVTNDRLTEAVQWFAAGELFLCAMLKKFKLNKKEGLKDELDNRELESDTDSCTGNSRAG